MSPVGRTGCLLPAADGTGLLPDPPTLVETREGLAQLVDEYEALGIEAETGGETTHF